MTICISMRLLNCVIFRVFLISFMSEVPNIVVDAADDIGAPATSSSRHSTASSIYSEGALSDDSELKLVGKSDRFKDLLKFSSKKVIQYDTLEETAYYNTLRQTLETYHRHRDVNWGAVLEQCLFGDIIDHLFNPRFEYSGTIQSGTTYPILKKKGDNIMCHLLYADMSYEQLRYEVPKIDILYISNDELVQLLKALVKDLTALDQVLELYSKNTNTTSGRLLTVLTSLAHNATLPMPLAQAMLGNWRLSYERSELRNAIIAHFRSAARCGLLYNNLNNLGYFSEVLNEDYFQAHELICLNRFLAKDYKSALGMSLFNIGQYLQMHHDFDSATDVWEIGAHMSGDTDCCNMAIWGLMDGFGSSNIKSINKFSSKYKASKFVSKRRIAQLYRILIKTGKSSEIGTSWVWKLKYD